jgi:predicted phage terminase large subunit-like protein
MLAQADLSNLSDNELTEYLDLKELLIKQEAITRAKEDFLEFVNYMFEDFIIGPHHKIMAESFKRVADGDLKRVLLNVAPRHGKSLLTSQYLPAWMIGKDPSKKLMAITHTTDLAVHFGRTVRDIIQSDKYAEIFPNTNVRADSKSAGKWQTEEGGEFFAAGVGASVTGRGADLLILDDPHSEQDLLSPNAFDSAWQYYSAGPRQRLQPGGTIIVVQTRWSTEDITGHLLEEQMKSKDADQWEQIEFPAIMPSGKPLWPGFWSIDELKAVKASLFPANWSAQWMQNPMSEEASILKRGYWSKWIPDTLPSCTDTIMTMDTAFQAKETADFSVITVWGVFYPDGECTTGSGDYEKKRNFDGTQAHIILLDRIRGRFEFPELKAKAFSAYQDWTPDVTIIENKASGQSLIQEFRFQGIPVQEFTPNKGQDKVIRAHSVSDILHDGKVWYPESKWWADELVDECHGFPFSAKNDDQVDATTMALAYFRKAGYIQLRKDWKDELGKDWKTKSRSYY